MILGRTQTLIASHFTQDGHYLIDEDKHEVLLPKRHVPEGLEKGDAIEVFLYKDSQNRWIATVQECLIESGTCALLRIDNSTDVGAFAEIGIDKQLLIPFSEQREDLEAGDEVIVHCYEDRATERLVGSTKLNKHLTNEHIDFLPLEEVSVMGWYHSDLGLNVVVNGKYIGLIHQSDFLGSFKPGEVKRGYVAKQRSDRKLDIILRKPGFQNIAPEGQKIMALLQKENGFLPYTDKSDPDTIRKVFNMSKKTFKKAIGGLYRDRVITIEVDGIKKA